LLAVRKEFYYASDSGFLIRTGEYIYHNLKIPDRDFFSHTFNGRPWLLDRWAPCLFFFLLYHFLGISGAILVKAGIVTAGFFILMIILLREKRDPLIVFAAVLLGAVASRGRFELRPQVISMLIFALQIYLTEQYLANRGRRSILVKLVILLAVWANLHSEWAYGIFYLALVLAVEVGEGIYAGIRGKATDRVRWRDSLPLFYALLVSIILSFFTVYLINPNGFEVLLLPFRMAQSQIWSQTVQELMPIYFSPGNTISFYFYAGVLILGIGLGCRKIVPRDVVILLFFGVLTILHRRVLQVFVFITLPLQVRYWDYALSSFRDRIGRRFREPRKFFFASRVVLQLGLALSAGLIISSGVINDVEERFGLGFDDRFYPEKAFRYIQENNLSGNYFNDADAGGEMILFLYPQVRIFIDGRFMDLYDDSFYQESYLRISSGFPGWERQLDMYQVDYVLVRSIYDFGLRPVIERNRRWKKIYDDGDTWIYGRSN